MFASAEKTDANGPTGTIGWGTGVQRPAANHDRKDPPMADNEPTMAGDGGNGQPDEGAFEVRFADRVCPRCRSRFVASYYQDGGYVKSRCLDCMLFWPTPMMA